jgi:copper resistance protein D
VPLWLLLQVGGINQGGISGMFDMTMAALLLQSTLGWVAALRIGACAVVLVAASRLRAGRTGQWLFAVATLLACSSVVMTGHVSTLSIVARTLLLLHVLGAALWIGSLYPLQQVCGPVRGVDQLAALQTLMRRFGRVAVVIVSVLLPAGLILAYQLLQTPSALWTTAYGMTLLAKVILVCGLLLLAALNKLLWVPRLLQTGAEALQRSIRLEMTLALLVLAFTSWLTTVTGPAAM